METKRAEKHNNNPLRELKQKEPPLPETGIGGSFSGGLLFSTYAAGRPLNAYQAQKNCQSGSSFYLDGSIYLLT